MDKKSKFPQCVWGKVSQSYFQNLDSHIHYSSLDYPGFCNMKFRIIKNPELILSLAVIAYLAVDKIGLNPELFQSTDTAYCISAVNQLLEWQSVTSNVCPYCQNWGEFLIRKHLWSKASGQQQREAASLQREEASHAVVKHQFLPTLSSWGRVLAAVLKSTAELFNHCLPSCPSHPITPPGGAGKQGRTF